MSKSLYTKRLSIGITDAMNDKLEELAVQRTRKGKTTSLADLVREALRMYLDEQPDLKGSRKQVSKTLETQIEHLTQMFAAQEQQLVQIQQQLNTLPARIEQALGKLVEFLNKRFMNR